MREPKICKHCGAQYVRTRYGVCESCGSFVRKHGRLPEMHEIKRRNFKPKVCTHCGMDCAATSGLCHSCYAYRAQYGHDRPESLWKKVQERRERKAFCANCSENFAAYMGLCRACYEYKRRNKKSRPRRLFTEKCLNCGSKNVYLKGLCRKCYDYQYYHGVPRPEHICKQHAPYGLCDCGKPAVQEVTLKVGPSKAKFKVCAECLKEEQRSIY